MGCPLRSVRHWTMNQRPRSLMTNDSYFSTLVLKSNCHLFLKPEWKRPLGRPKCRAGNENRRLFEILKTKINVDVCMSIHHKYISRVQQTNATFSRSIYFYNCSTCFRRFLRPSSRAQNCTYSVRYCQTNTAIVDEMELTSSCCCSRQQYWFDNTWCCMYSFVLLMMGGGTA